MTATLNRQKEQTTNIQHQQPNKQKYKPTNKNKLQTNKQNKNTNKQTNKQNKTKIQTNKHQYKHQQFLHLGPISAVSLPDDTQQRTLVKIGGALTAGLYVRMSAHTVKATISESRLAVIWRAASTG